MRKILIIFLFFTQILFGLEVYVNSGIKNSSPITILHLKNKTDFTCTTKIKDGLRYYECIVKGKTKLVANQNLPEFELVFENQTDKLVINIYPKIKSFIHSSDNILHKNSDFLSQHFMSAKHFVILFENDLKLEQERYNGLDFGMTFNKTLMPFVGALDLDQKPVSFSKTNDVNIFIDIKKNFENERYAEVLEETQMAMKKYPDSIFTKDFIMYFIRSQLALSKKSGEYLRSVIQTSKAYIRQYPSDNNYAEILSILVKAYLQVEQKSDAEYFIDILSTEHKDNYFTKVAKLDYADYLSMTNRGDEALKLYNEILFSTNNTALISRSAVALAKINISHNKMALAKEYIQKVINSNKSYLLENKEQSFKIANEFFDAKFYDISGIIYQDLYDNTTKADLYHEKVLLNLASSYYHSSKEEEAKKYLKEYQYQFPNGNYLTEVEQMYDSLFFSNKTASSEELHKYYKMLMKKYDNEIAKRALEEEIKLLYTEEKYSQILEYTDLANKYDEKNSKSYIYKSAAYLLNEDLSNNNCHIALKLSKKYTIKAEDIKDNKSMLNCYMRTSQYEDALSFIEEHYEEDVVFYKLNEFKILYLGGKYKKILDDIQKIEKDRFIYEKYELFDLYYYKSLSLLHLNKYNEAIFALKTLEKSSNEFKIVEVYDEFLDYFVNNNLIESVLNYGKKSIDLQNKYGINLYSPKHEFILIWALVESENYTKAREIFDDLFKLQLSDDDFTKAKFLSGEIYQITKDTIKAKEEYLQCKSGKYKQLCDDALKLMENQGKN